MGRIRVCAAVALLAFTCVAGRAAPAKVSDANVRPGALLRVNVSGHSDLNNIYRVDLAGTILLPGIGSVTVNGLELPAIERLIASRLAANGKTPKVRVTYDTSLQSVFVAGEVRTPGMVTMKGPLSLMAVLARAGSPTVSAADALVIIHDEFTDSPAHDAGQERVNLSDLRAGHDVMLHDGDTVYVPRAPVFYILGEVRQPGVYVLRPGMSVMQGIAAAGGLTSSGSDRGVKILRSVDGRVTESDADGGTIIQPNDTVRVRRKFF